MAQRRLEGPFKVGDILDGPVAFEDGTLWFAPDTAKRQSFVRFWARKAGVLAVVAVVAFVYAVPVVAVVGLFWKATR